jgi:hypothetical protein
MNIFFTKIHFIILFLVFILDLQEEDFTNDDSVRLYFPNDIAISQI